MSEVVYWGIFLLGGLAFGWWSWRRGSLSAAGAGGAVLLGGVVTLTAGVAWLLPLFAFFFSSSLIGRFFPAPGVVSDGKDRQARDLVQVVCNGGVYGALAFFDWEPTLMLIAVAVATADTWASELGKHFRQPTFDVLRWRRVPVGLSGGVSKAGNLGGAAGALFIGTLGFGILSEFTTLDLTAVAAFGFLGMLLDSVLGATLQARYRDPSSGVLSDVRPLGGELASGYRWVTNDLVNLLAIALTVAAALLLT